ncbi:hypothetical protein [Natrinema sp. 74]|uniref:hypothetical protein n=1 Tax=Natrinema sp. 74 TaxID=3384159 RepID=UPI0038D3AB0B
MESVETAAYTRHFAKKRLQSRRRDAETVDCGGVAFKKTLARMTVADSVTGFLRYSHPNDDSPAEQTFDEPLPPSTVSTTGLFFTVPSTVEASLVAQTDDRDDYLSALHAIEHALISLYPREVLCDRADIGGRSRRLLLKWYSRQRHRTVTSGIQPQSIVFAQETTVEWYRVHLYPVNLTFRIGRVYITPRISFTHPRTA